MQEKTQLLLRAYEAIEEQDREIMRERSEYESRIESLRQSLVDSQMGGGSNSTCGQVLPGQDSSAVRWQERHEIEREIEGFKDTIAKMVWIFTFWHELCLKSDDILGE